MIVNSDLGISLLKLATSMLNNIYVYTKFGIMN